MLTLENLVDVLDLKYLDEKSSYDLAARSVALLHRDGVFNSEKQPRSRFINELSQLARSEQIQKHTHTGRTTNSAEIFSADRDSDGNFQLRNFLFQASSNLPEEAAAPLSELRLFLLDKALQASQLSINREASIEGLCGYINLALKAASDNNLYLKFTRLFLSLNVNLTLSDRLALWSSRLSTNQISKTAAERRKIDEAYNWIASLQRGIFKRIGSSDETDSYIPNPNPAPLKIFSYDTTEFQGNDHSIAVIEPKEDRKLTSIRVNQGQANRISQSPFRVDQNHRYYWPTNVCELFDLEIKKLKESDSLFDQLKGLSLETAALLALQPSDVLLLPVTTKQVLPSENWHIFVENEELFLRRPRLERLNSVQLPHSLKDFCHPISTEFLIHLPGYHEIAKKMYEQLDLKEISCFINLTGLAPEITKLTKKTKDIKESGIVIADFINEWILKGFKSRDFFNVEAIRYQAIRLLREKFNDETTAELAIANSSQSTSALTSYTRKLLNGFNCAGSQLSMTKPGIQELTRLIDGRFHHALEDNKSQQFAWEELLNLASERIWLLDLACTGRRATATGIESFGEISENLGYAFLEDKFVEGYEEGRIVYIPSLLKKELLRFKEFLILVAKTDHVPKAFRDHCNDLLQGCSRAKAPLTVLILRSKESGDELIIQELSPRRIFEKYFCEASGLENIFRHFWAQVVTDETLDPELTRAQLGHSDSLNMLYGDISNRTRKTDVDRIGKIIESRICDFNFDTDRFWKQLTNDLALCESDSPSTRIEFPQYIGRARRKVQRERERTNIEERLRKELVRIDQELNVNHDDPSESFHSDEAENDQNDLRKKHLNNSDLKLKGIRPSVLNRLLQEADWPFVISTFRKSQEFPSHAIFKNIKYRDKFEKFYVTLNKESDPQTVVVCKVIKLIYRYQIISNSLLVNLFKPEYSRVVNLPKNSSNAHLEIATRSALKDGKNGQCLRLKISSDLVDIPETIKLIDKEKSAQTAKLLELFETNPDFDIKQFLISVQTQALDIARFEQVASIATNFGNDIPTSSSGWASLGVSDGTSPSRSIDLAEFNDPPISKSFIDEKSNPSERVKSLKSQIYTALKAQNWRQSRDELKCLYKTISQEDTLINYRHIVKWAQHCIDRNNGRKLETSTVRTYLHTTFELMYLLNTSHVESMDSDDIEFCFKEHESSIPSLRNSNNFIAATNSFIGFLADEVNEEFEGFYLRDPQRLSKRVKTEWISERAFQKLISKLYCKGSFAALEEICLVSCLYRFGLRINEAKFLLCLDVHALDTQLCGLRIAKNNYRVTKGRKPPKHIFVNEHDPLTKIERDCWAELLASKLTTFGTMQTAYLLFSDGIRNAQRLTLLLENIRNCAKNNHLNFHSLRHSFANRRFICVSEVPKMIVHDGSFAKNNAISCNALGWIRDGLRHSSITTSWQCYIHTANYVIDASTDGRRRGKRLPEEISTVSEEVSTVSEVEKPSDGSSSSKSTRPSRPNVSCEERNDLDLFAWVHLVMQGEKIRLNAQEYELLKRFIPNGLEFHPSAPQINLDPSTQQLEIKFGKYKPSFSHSEDHPNVMIENLRSLLKVDYDINLQVSHLQDVISCRGEVLLANSTDFRWIKALGLSNEFFTLEKPPRSMGFSSERYAQAFDTSVETLEKFVLVQADINVGNFYGALGLTKGQMRLRLRYKNLQKEIDTYTFVVLLLLIRIHQTNRSK